MPINRGFIKQTKVDMYNGILSTCLRVNSVSVEKISKIYFKRRKKKCARQCTRYLTICLKKRREQYIFIYTWNIWMLEIIHKETIAISFGEGNQWLRNRNRKKPLNPFDPSIHVNMLIYDLFCYYKI